ncbi:MAG: YgeY family selenium metabolism-linked hydrolase [Elusimicrobiota bacterium]|nr:YgeY family selenium metabolism-linked hydrolase [Elusimicrobiota bacterium]
MEKEILKFLKDIVSISSISGAEGKVAQRIAAEMRKLKYDNVHIDRIGNVIGKIGSGKKKILYDAHIDTVSIGDIRLWRTPPYRAIYKNGLLYGRGTCDDKGCVAAIVYGSGMIKKRALLGDFSLYVSCSVQEEVAEGYGIRYLLKHLNFNPDYVVIGEPSNLKIVRGHKGRAEIKIAVYGKAAHASIPEKGKNAIYDAMKLIDNIKLLNKKYIAHSELGKPVISVTKVESETPSINTIPDNCAIYVDRRTVVGETKESITSELLKVCKVSKVKAKIEYLKKFFNAWILPEDHRFIKLAIDTYKKSYNVAPEVIIWPFCTNGSFTMGERKIPTIGFGPGDWKYAHCANEQIKVTDVIKAVEFYATFPKVLGSG